MNFIIKLFLNSLAVIIASLLLSSGVHVEGWGNAVLLAAVLVLLNASVKPLLVFFTLPFTLFTLGLFLLVINASIILIADWILGDGFKVDSFWWALAFSIILSLLNSFLERLVVKNERPNGQREVQREGDMQVFDKDGNRIA
jgi:putative membrane protein